MVKKTFTWDELRQKNSSEQLYVAVRGKVYDVTKFVDRHPGGRDVLMMAGGRDVTMVFESYHAFSDKAHKVLEKHYVGELVSHKYPTYPEPGLFFKTVRERVQKYFKDNNKDPKDPETMWIRLILLPVIYYALSIAQTMWCHSWEMILSCLAWLADNLLLASFAAIATGWIGAIIAMSHTHDSSHFAITHSPWVWKAIGIGTHNFVLGCSYYVWVLQHVFGHHPYTNIDGADPDIVTSTDHPDLRRIKETQNWIPPYFVQHIYAPIIYGLLTMKTHFQDFVVILKGRNSTMSMNSMSLTNQILFWSGKLAYIIQRLVIPLYFLPLSRVLWVNVLIEAMASYWLALIFQISHVVSEVEWPQPNKDNHVPCDWAELQIVTTLDYSTDNWFWNTFTGALNHQTAHHLFPGVCQIHYPQITPIVRKTCEEFDIRYNYLPSFKDALFAHLGHLKRLGQNRDVRTYDARSG